jgi:hypothetical protein
MLKFYHTTNATFTRLEGKGNKYQIGKAIGNGGNLAECYVQEFYGYGFKFDTDHIAFDKGSDIEELGISVKSSGASLACLYRDEPTAENMESLLTEYFDRVHSTRWAYVAIIDGVASIYEMNATEFKEFVTEWAGWNKESGKTCYKIKFKKTSGKMLTWLDERAGE